MNKPKPCNKLTAIIILLMFITKLSTTINLGKPAVSITRIIKDTIRTASTDIAS